MYPVSSVSYFLPGNCLEDGRDWPREVVYGRRLDEAVPLRVEGVHPDRAPHHHAAPLKLRSRREVLHGAAPVPVSVLGLSAWWSKFSAFYMRRTLEG